MKNKLVLRYFLCLVGLLLFAFGVAFITKAALGNTPISAIPYTLSLMFPKLSFGKFSIVILMCFIAAQVILLRKKSRPLDILIQIPISFLFGYVIDFSMMILSGFQPESYPVKMISMLLGCVILSVGAYFKVVADVAMLPPDGFTQALAKVTGKDFGTIKLLTDGAQVLIALVLGLVFLHVFACVREGTIIGVVLNGNLVKLIGKLVHMDRLFAVENASVSEA